MMGVGLGAGRSSGSCGLAAGVFICCLLGFGSYLVAFSTTFWWKSSTTLSKTNVHQWLVKGGFNITDEFYKQVDKDFRDGNLSPILSIGLWKCCECLKGQAELGDYCHCDLWDERDTLPSVAEAPAWFLGVQALSCFAVIFLGLTLLYASINLCLQSVYVIVPLALLNIFAVLCLLTSVILFAVKIDDNDIAWITTAHVTSSLSPRFEQEYSFYFSLVGGLFTFVSAIMASVQWSWAVGIRKSTPKRS